MFIDSKQNTLAGSNELVGRVFCFEHRPIMQDHVPPRGTRVTSRRDALSADAPIHNTAGAVMGIGLRSTVRNRGRKSRDDASGYLEKRSASDGFRIPFGGSFAARTKLGLRLERRDTFLQLPVRSRCRSKLEGGPEFACALSTRARNRNAHGNGEHNYFDLAKAIGPHIDRRFVKSAIDGAKKRACPAKQAWDEHTDFSVTVQSARQLAQICLLVSSSQSDSPFKFSSYS